jgi:hypothetical protein
MGIAHLADYAGDWVGTNGFRLMPTDELATRPASATLSMAAGTHLASLAYRWEHPDDGPQDGLVVVGVGADADSALALWGDSWHQQPEPRSMPGQLAEGAIHLAAAYGGGWEWRLIVEAEAKVLRMRMENVVPDDRASAGPYEVMLMELTRSA